MKITLNTVVDTFIEYALINHIPMNENRTFSCATFIPDDPCEMEKDVLYIVDLADPGLIIKPEERFSYLCINTSDKGRRDSIPEGCLLVEGIDSIFTLAKLIQKRFQKLQEWENNLKNIVIDGGNYQDLLDASEYVIGNPVQILDASYKLLATTMNLRSDDAIDMKLVESGFHSQDSLRKIQESGRLKAYKEETGILINHPGNPNKYGTVGRWLWDSGMPVIHILMICMNGSPSPALIDMFQVLSDHCRMCFVRNQSQNPQTGRIYDSLINDLLFGNLTDVAEIEERAKVANIPTKGCFTLCKIVLKENNEWLIKRVYSELFQHLPGARIIIHQFEIIVLNSYDSANKFDLIKKDEKQMVSVIKTFDALCGVSAPFERITEIPVAFYQAAKALTLGEMVNESQVMKSDEVDGIFLPGDFNSVYNFDDMIVYYIMSLGLHKSSDSLKKSSCWNIVKNMWEEDVKTDNDNSQILFTYLVSERKATRTGEILHMHRNNVIYRINKIEEMTGLNLDDYWVRMKLLIAFHMLKLEISSGLN